MRAVFVDIPSLDHKRGGYRLFLSSCRDELALKPGYYRNFLLPLNSQPFHKLNATPTSLETKPKALPYYQSRNNTASSFERYQNPDLKMTTRYRVECECFPSQNLHAVANQPCTVDALKTHRRDQFIGEFAQSRHLSLPLSHLIQIEESPAFEIQMFDFCPHFKMVLNAHNRTAQLTILQNGSKGCWPSRLSYTPSQRGCLSRGRIPCSRWLSRRIVVMRRLCRMWRI